MKSTSTKLVLIRIEKYKSKSTSIQTFGISYTFSMKNSTPRNKTIQVSKCGQDIIGLKHINYKRYDLGGDIESREKAEAAVHLRLMTELRCCLQQLGIECQLKTSNVSSTSFYILSILSCNKVGHPLPFSFLSATLSISSSYFHSYQIRM